MGAFEEQRRDPLNRLSLMAYLFSIVGQCQGKQRKGREYFDPPIDTVWEDDGRHVIILYRDGSVMYRDYQGQLWRITAEAIEG